MEHVTKQQLIKRQSTVWRALRAAAPQTIPVLAGYFVLGMGYGIYVQSLGLPVWMPMLMGTVVYGGSLEFVLASLLLSAFSPLSAFLMALMIQARHLFYGLAMLAHGWRASLFPKNRSRTVCAIWTVILTPPPSSVRFCGSHRTLRPRGNAYALHDRPIFCRLLSLHFRPYQ